MEFRGAMGGLYRITEWIMRFSVTNVLWLLCSAPFFFLLFTKVLLSQQNFVNESLLTNWLMAIVAPFTLFPATAAMFSVVRKWVMGETDAALIRTFFKGYKGSYKQAMIGGFFYTILFVVMYFDYVVYMTQLSSFQFIGYVMLGLLIMLFVSLFNFFSMLSHVHMGTFQLVKNSILLTLIRPLRIILTTVISGMVLYFCLFHMPALFFVFAGSVIAYYAFFNFHAAFHEIQENNRKLDEEQEVDTQDTEAKLDAVDNAPVK
ncbi:YesL family protein [Paenibacillus sp. 481]|uniref:YesL family protein n=1 Tax=Paenibacillus sp. 481 TaxID=2835869 RepID=UPI001E41F69C|nr:DUF624 domain-containing protein [Paenibacillus sp. 481]UHA72601.1 DUF624 domain-containing protein [Paenibacillus sp. 481]